jgi:hypothetical protein
MQAGIDARFGLADRLISRREMLELSGLGFGSLALTYLLNRSSTLLAASGDRLNHSLKPRRSHFEGPAKAVIQLMQNGGPSQMDLFDPKPELNRRDGQTYGGEIEIFQPGNTNVLLGSPFKFKPRGQSGMPFSEIIPNLGGVVDDISLVRSMYTEHNNHTEALIMFQTCKIFPGRPGLGSWISYALGTENQNLPAYVVLRDPAGYNTSGKVVWSSGFLPTLYQGVEFSSSGSPVHHLNAALPQPPNAQKDNLDLLSQLNRSHQRLHPRESELESRIRNFELAARMQLAAADVLDISGESETTKKLYGLDNPVTAGYGMRCLLARRLVESGVRFVQIFPPPFQPWDQHMDLKNDLEKICAVTDQPSAALINDLKERGLLDGTIVMWTGEFGRLPTTQHGNGRDHNRNAFSLILSGGGFRKGLIYGETDELAYKAVVNRVSVPDLHATVLHLLGLDHKRVLYPHDGNEENPTDAKVNDARVVSGLLESPPQA